MKLAMISRHPDGQPRTPPLLFVHGSFTDARIWDVNYLPYFARHGYTAHAVSLRGHGLSDGGARLLSWRLADYVTDLALTVANLPAMPVLIGHSMGGMVVQKFLETRPAIPGVALLASVPPRGLIWSNLDMALRHPFLFQQVALFSLFGSAFETPELTRRLLFSKDMPLGTITDCLGPTQPESLLVAMDMMGMNPLRLEPGAQQLPLLVQGAAEDVFISPAIVRETAGFYRTEAQVFPKLAHAMMLDVNWRNAADSLLSWLDQAVGTGEPAAA